jgi:hypothetical protein
MPSDRPRWTITRVTSLDLFKALDLLALSIITLAVMMIGLIFFGGPLIGQPDLVARILAGL